MPVNWPEAILIDFYGTVVEEIHIPVQGICARICSLKPGLAEPEVMRYWVDIFNRMIEESHDKTYLLQKEIEKRSLQSTIQHFDIELDSADLSQKLIDYRSHPTLFPESLQVLRQVRLPLCLVTNIDNIEIKSALQYTGLHFDFVVTSEDCRAYKPRADIFNKALKTLGKSTGQVLHVGDSYQGDILGARALGIKVLWIDRRVRPLPAGSVTPDYTAHDLTGLLPFIAN